MAYEQLILGSDGWLGAGEWDPPLTELRRLIFRYCAERQATGEVTKATAADLRYRLIRFVGDDDRPTQRIRANHVKAMLTLTKDRSPGYRRNLLSAFRGFCEWCVLNGHMQRDPTVGVKAPKNPKQRARALRLEESRAVVGGAPDARARAMLLLLFQEGARRGEVAAIELGDIDFRKRTLDIRGKGGQGRVTRQVPLSGETFVALERYLAEHPCSAGPVFRCYTDPSRALAPATITRIVSGIMYDTGVKQAPYDGRSAHAGRHTAANDMLDEGAEPEEVQVALGHENLATTFGVYVRGRAVPLRDAMSGRSYMPRMD